MSIDPLRGEKSIDPRKHKEVKEGGHVLPTKGFCHYRESSSYGTRGGTGKEEETTGGILLVVVINGGSHYPPGFLV